MSNTSAAYRRPRNRDRLAALVAADQFVPTLLSPPAPPRLDETEANFQALIVDLAERFRWWTFHPLSSKGSNPGYPDLTMLRYEGARCRALWVEVKTSSGRLRPEQVRVGQMLLAAGLDFRVWRPGMWLADIVPTLTTTGGDDR